MVPYVVPFLLSVCGVVAELLPAVLPVQAAGHPVHLLALSARSCRGEGGRRQVGQHRVQHRDSTGQKIRG